MEKWYVIQVLTGHEERVKRSCIDMIDDDILEECFIPYIIKKKKYKGEWHDIEEILFKGYVFMISDDIDRLYQELKKVPEITKMLGRKDKVIYPIEDKEVEFISEFAKDNHKIDMSYGFIVDDKITITGGPLEGKEGMIRKIDRHKRKAVIEISFLNQIVIAEVGLEIISKVSSDNK